METGFETGVATLVAMTDGTTSLYTSTGGGVIGGGEHESVRRESAAFLEEVERQLDTLPRTGATPLPEPGIVQLVAMTSEGTRGVTMVEDDLVNGDHPLAPMFFAGHRVLTALRLIEQGGRSNY